MVAPHNLNNDPAHLLLPPSATHAGHYILQPVPIHHAQFGFEGSLARHDPLLFYPNYPVGQFQVPHQRLWVHSQHMTDQLSHAAQRKSRESWTTAKPPCKQVQLPGVLKADQTVMQLTKPIRHTAPSPIPTFPRGPSRKPKQSPHALWVGNLHPDTTLTELKDHLSANATSDIQSVFLISKSQCAFANYRTMASREAARAHVIGSRFHGKRLVCKLRLPPAPVQNAEVSIQHQDLSLPALDSAETSTALSVEGVPLERPTIVNGNTCGVSPTEEVSIDARPEPREEAPESDVAQGPDRFFILKSLTVEDLLASVRDGIWQTQEQNEKLLDGAFRHSQNVYLIFSANKSGEYFGLARMKTAIYDKKLLSPLHTSPTTRESAGAQSVGLPQLMFSPSTNTAPSGWIYDDSERDVLFWEATDVASPSSIDGLLDTESQVGQRQFNVEWMTTSRLSFHYTRGLRNPWNNDKEVKIARDGTELEPRTGRRLASMLIAQNSKFLGSQRGANTNTG